MRKIRVQPHPTAVAAAIRAGDLVPEVGRRSAGDAQIALAAALDRGVAHVDRGLLALSGAQPPQLGRDKRRRRDARLRGGSDRERGGQHRVGAGELYALERGRIAGGLAPQRGQRLCGEPGGGPGLLRERGHDTARRIARAPAISTMKKIENAVAFTSSSSLRPKSSTLNGKYPFSSYVLPP